VCENIGGNGEIAAPRHPDATMRMNEGEHRTRRDYTPTSPQVEFAERATSWGFLEASFTPHHPQPNYSNTQWLDSTDNKPAIPSHTHKSIATTTQNSTPATKSSYPDTPHRSLCSSSHPYTHPGQKRSPCCPERQPSSTGRTYRHICHHKPRARKLGSHSCCDRSWPVTGRLVLGSLGCSSRLVLALLRCIG
jgi:hypothetical protein